MIALLLAAPIVGGYIATVMSQRPTQLFSRSGEKSVQWIKDWIEKMAFWTRPSGYKVLWNRVSDELVDLFKDDENNDPGCCVVC